MPDLLPDIEGANGLKRESLPVVVFGPDGQPVSSGRSALQEALRDGRSFLSATAEVQAGTGDRLYTILRNPADSGRNVFLYNRIFGNNQAPSDANIEYRAHIMPTATLAQSGLAANGIIGDPASPSTTFTYEVGNIAMGGVEATGEQLPNGTPYSRRVDVMLRPGVSVGFSVRGVGDSTLSNTVTLSVILEWWEEPV